MTKSKTKSAKKAAKNQAKAAEAKKPAKAAAPRADAKKAGGTDRRVKGQMSGLAAAAKVLAEAGEALNCKAITERAMTKGYWKPGGKTPASTLYAAILRDMRRPNGKARFKKAGRGKFALNK